MCVCVYIIVTYILVSQLSPVYPVTHLHVCRFTASVHVPPFPHGLLEHSIISTTQNIVLHIKTTHEQNCLHIIRNKSIFTTYIFIFTIVCNDFVAT